MRLNPNSNEIHDVMDDAGPLLCMCQAHSSSERAGLLAGVRCHKVTSDAKECMRGPALRDAIEHDRALGLVPFFVSQFT